MKPGDAVRRSERFGPRKRRRLACRGAWRASRGHVRRRLCSDSPRLRFRVVDALRGHGRKVSTLRGYERNLESYDLPHLGHVALQDLRVADVDALYAELVGSGGAQGA